MIMANIPGFDFYGGSTVMRFADAKGTPFMSCCATKHSNGVFGFYIFKGKELTEVPITPFCTGRGSMNLGGWWVAANGKEFFTGQIPGFVPWPNTAALNDPRVDGLVSQFAALNQKINALETALDNIDQETGALDPKDRDVINRWRSFFGLD